MLDRGEMGIIVAGGGSGGGVGGGVGKTAEALMAVEQYKPARLFTIDQANAMLPLVRAITTDLANLAKDVVERRHRLALLTSGRDLKPGDPYSDELAQMEADLERDALRLQEYVEE